LRLTGETRVESDFGEMLDDIHAVEGSEQVGAAGDGAVVGKEHGVVMGNVGFEDGAEIGSAGSRVTNKRNFAEANDNFGQQSLVEPLTGGRESGGRGRMSVANGVDVGTHAIEEDVHANFGRGFAFTLEVAAFEIDDDKIGGRHHAFVQASGSGEYAVGVKANREITFRGDDVAAFVEPATDLADVAAVLLFGKWTRVRR
jgi:hypothetical protein